MDRREDTSTAWLEAAAESGGIALFCWEIARDRVLVSSHFEQRFSVPSGASLDVLLRCAREPSREHLGEALRELAASEGGATLVHRFEAETGWAELRARLEPSRADAPARVVGTLLDATSTRALEARTSASEERTRALMDALPGLGLVLDEDGRYGAVFAHDETLLAADRATLVGRTMHEILPAEVADGFLAQVRGCLDEGRARRVEYELPVGPRRLHFEARVAPIPGGWNGRRAVVWIANDVSELRRAEHALRESEAHLRAIVEHSDLVVYRIDRAGRILFSAGRGLAKLGYAPGELVGRDIREITQGEDLDYVLGALEGEEYHRESVYGGLHMQTHMIPLRDARGEPAGCVGVSFDVSELARARLEREAMLAELEAKNAELERFNYTVSHDLKTPLVTIQGFVELLARDLERGDHARVTRDLEHVAKASTRMHALLDDLLELSRAGRIARPSDVALGEVVAEALAQLEGPLRASGATVVVASDLPRVWADRTRLLQVLQNLVDNALKHGGDDAPRVEIGQHPSGAFFVRDQGVGIAPRHHATIFGLFERLSAATEGTGLGLALARRIVEAHGGKLWVESSGVPGEGAAFFFTLPARRAES